MQLEERLCDFLTAQLLFLIKHFFIYTDKIFISHYFSIDIVG